MISLVVEKVIESGTVRMRTCDDASTHIDITMRNKYPFAASSLLLHHFEMAASKTCNRPRSAA
jgi:hypothetical protein